MEKRVILVPHGDYKTLASKINALLDDREYRLRLGANARDLTLQYSWSKIVDKYVSVIEGVMHS